MKKKTKVKPKQQSTGEQWLDNETKKKVCLHCTQVSDNPCDFNKKRQSTCTKARDLAW